jgi:hypothetical protein
MVTTLPISGAKYLTSGCCHATSHFRFRVKPSPFGTPRLKRPVERNIFHSIGLRVVVAVVVVVVLVLFMVLVLLLLLLFES